MLRVQAPQILVESGAFESLIPAFDFPHGAAMPWVVADDIVTDTADARRGYVAIRRKRKKRNVRRALQLPRIQTYTPTAIGLENLIESFELEEEIKRKKQLLQDEEDLILAFFGGLI